MTFASSFAFSFKTSIDPFQTNLFLILLVYLQMKSIEARKEKSFPKKWKQSYKINIFPWTQKLTDAETIAKYKKMKTKKSFLKFLNKHEDGFRK